MKLIVGLGNPSPLYAHTRHNAGFMALDFIRDSFEKEERAGTWSFSKKFNADSAEGKIKNRRMIFLKPLTFMNESGRAVKTALLFYKIKLSDCVIVYDDIDLAFGNIRLRLGGSSGGHKGMLSIINQLGTENIPRLRIGVNPNHHKIQDGKNFVLKKFSKEEQKKLPEIFASCEQALRLALAESFVKAMSLYNKKSA